MSPNTAQAIALLQQALQLLQADCAQPQLPVPAPAAAPVAAPAAGIDPNLVMKFGRNKDKSLAWIAANDPKYLKWIVDKFGRDDNGNEDPKWAAANAKYRATAQYLINQYSGAAAAPAVPQPVYAAPAVPAAPADPVYEDDIPF